MVVLHAELSFDLLNYAQESGQAGRDKLQSEAIVLLAEDRIVSKYKDTDERLLWEYMLWDGCRRVKLDQYLDGNLETVCCLEKQEKCDNCREKDGDRIRRSQAGELYTAGVRKYIRRESRRETYME